MKKLLFMLLTVLALNAQDYIMAPDGTYLPNNANGTGYILTPEGNYVAGDSVVITPDGNYLGVYDTVKAQHTDTFKKDPYE